MRQIGPCPICGWSSIIEPRQTRALRGVSVPYSIHTGGKSEAQLTNKQAVLLMHDIYMKKLFNLVFKKSLGTYKHFIWMYK